MAKRNPSTAVTTRTQSHDIVAQKILDTLDTMQQQLEHMNARLMVLESGNLDEIGMRAAYAEAKKGMLGSLARIAVTRELYQSIAGDGELPPLPQELPPEFFGGHR